MAEVYHIADPLAEVPVDTAQIQTGGLMYEQHPKEGGHSDGKYPPYFLYPLVQALEGARGEEAMHLRQRIAANVGDISALRELFGLDSESLACFYPDMAGVHLSTSETIEGFLDRFGSNLPAVDAPLVPIAPQIDYAGAFLQGEGEDTAPLSLGDLASALNSAEPLTRVVDSVDDASPAAPASEGSGATLTESLAKIMIKNGKYEKALEIICELNLKNPKKSAYFADQIRFLKKLIANASKS